MRAVLALWHREIVRFLRDRPRLVGSLMQPVVFWALFSGALHGRSKPGGMDWRGKTLSSARSR
jgi:hypothetical protein